MCGKLVRRFTVAYMSRSCDSCSNILSLLVTNIGALHHVSEMMLSEKRERENVWGHREETKKQSEVYLNSNRSAVMSRAWSYLVYLFLPSKATAIE